jgi:hypothetical protein
MGGTATTPHVIPILEANPNKNLSLQFISNELKKAGNPLTDPQITAVMGRLHSRYGVKVRTIMRGSMWLYDPDADDQLLGARKKKNVAPAPSGKAYELFELVGETGDGSKIVRDESLKLYKLTEI